jgi:transcription-repair coupling factor (superfamily II helicase)
VFHQNLNILRKFRHGEVDILLCTYRNLLSLMPKEEFWSSNTISVEKKQSMEPFSLVKQLADLGYNRVTMVSDPGEFSLRGDILDVYPVNDEPLRMEFWGDEIENLRYFSAETQRTSRYIQSACILPCRKVLVDEKNTGVLLNQLENLYIKQLKTLTVQAQDTLSENYRKLLENLQNKSYFEGCEYFLPYLEKDLASVFDFFPSETTVVFDESSEIFSKIDLQDKKYLENYNSNLQNGLVLPLNRLLHKNKIAVNAELKKFYKLNLDSFMGDGLDVAELLQCDILPRFSAQVDEICAFVNKLRKNGYLVIVSSQYPKRVSEILSCDDIPVVFVEDFKAYSDVLLCDYIFAEGFVSDDLKFAILTDNELFNHKAKKTLITKYRSNKEKPDYIENINDIKEGDYVVHLHHGIGIYTGITKQELDGEIKDYLTIEYAKGDKLHIPAEQINFLSRYRGANQASPILSRMGGADWEKVKAKVKKATEEVARELLQLYAKRKAAKGIVYDEDTPWQIEMEDAFPYTETPDQMFAINETKEDMESEKIMDRLICGDVGFGKTEVAIRAIFKAITSGKQVALLAPTTILAKQHYDTIVERFKAYPIKVDLLCRFRSQKEQKQTIKDLITGDCDLVIGTHRLLQKDVEFKKLGLIVVDEEHRFGVSHKEKLKQFKSELDVLTLSATPIPRTLYMSLSGIRDMSLIKTPPVNRAPIKTYVGEYNVNYVKSAINHELEREGQVYFLYNRVQSIYEFKTELQKHLPNARIEVAHGQMNEKELEESIYAFSNHEVDILLCTTIIESGLDIPNANTIIVYDADKFGLAQLYQIRGRVGRSERQAYAYCFYREGKVLTDEARNRLLANKDFTTLGSGYQIAMRDLEIRGIGHILGHKQHGHMITVGFDTYCQLLDEAVKEAQGEKTVRKTPTTVDINITAIIDDEWVGDKEQKIIEYKRLADVKSLRELELITQEWEDRFGKLPDGAKNLIRIIKIRLLATDVGISAIRQTPLGIRISTPYSQPEWGFITKTLPKEIISKLKWNKAPATVLDAKSYIILNNTYLSPEEVFNILESLFYHIGKLQNSFSNETDEKIKEFL